MYYLTTVVPSARIRQLFYSHTKRGLRFRQTFMSNDWTWKTHNFARLPPRHPLAYLRFLPTLCLHRFWQRSCNICLSNFRSNLPNVSICNTGILSRYCWKYLSWLSSLSRNHCHWRLKSLQATSGLDSRWLLSILQDYQKDRTHENRWHTWGKNRSKKLFSV